MQIATISRLIEKRTRRRRATLRLRLGENGEYLGRPVDTAQLWDGSLLVSGDFRRRALDRLR